ncbi:MAG TPA: RNA polymerase sigma factor [Acidimicrobiales bacterium]
MPATEAIRDLGFPSFPSLLAAAREGRPDALAQMFRTYQPRLLRYLRAQDPGMAEDLAADVWLAVARGLRRFDGDEAAFRGWVFTIARRRLVGHWRTQSRRRTEPLPDERLDSPVEQGWGGDPAWLVIERSNAQDAIDALVRDLSTDQAEALLLRVVGGLAVTEVAQVMDCSPGNVRVLCHRALKRLTTRMSEEALIE